MEQLMEQQAQKRSSTCTATTEPTEAQVVHAITAWMQGKHHVNWFHWFHISVKYFYLDSTSNFKRSWWNFDVFICKVSIITIPILLSPKYVQIRHLFEFYFFQICRPHKNSSEYFNL